MTAASPQLLICMVEVLTLDGRVVTLGALQSSCSGIRGLLPWGNLFHTDSGNPSAHMTGHGWVAVAVKYSLCCWGCDHCRLAEVCADWLLGC